MSEAGRWADLGPRVASAAVMLAVGGGALLVGGAAFMALCILVAAAMTWELVRMTAPEPAAAAAAAGLLAAVAVSNALLLPVLYGIAGVLLPVVVIAATASRLRLPAMGYAAAIVGACAALALLRETLGLWAVIWLVAVVMASDVAGYFAGRSLGGPRFWPAISPKKTWSGTLAGWAGAAVVGAGFALAGQGGWALVALSPLVAFAGQMGDIAESWFKRRAGVKDASALIPGHGGVLDRFDALIFAALAVAVLGLAGALPIPAGG